ncbi:MAG: pyridoxine 5'-phosphate synthase [Candidatus Eiseniibacteriota bacterium]|jgi:pyridoxine 5-phosphate synthase
MSTTPSIGNVPQLIVNLDAIALLRESSRSSEPDPVQAAAVAEAAGAAGIAVHLCEDRRHVQDRDVRLLKETVKGGFTLAIAPTEGLQAIAEAIKPDHVVLVPTADADGEESDQDLAAREDDLRHAVERLRRVGTRVGLLVQPDLELVKHAAEIGAQSVSIHIGGYARATDQTGIERELETLRNTADYAAKLGLRARTAGGVHPRKYEPLFEIDSFQEHELGHGLLARALMVGLGEAVRELSGLMRAARSLVPQYRA